MKQHLNKTYYTPWPGGSRDGLVVMCCNGIEQNTTEQVNHRLQAQVYI